MLSSEKIWLRRLSQILDHQLPHKKINQRLEDVGEKKGIHCETTIVIRLNNLRPEIQDGRYVTGSQNFCVSYMYFYTSI